MAPLLLLFAQWRFRVEEVGFGLFWCACGAQLRHLAVNVYSAFNKNDDDGKHDFLGFTIIKSTHFSVH